MVLPTHTPTGTLASQGTLTSRKLALAAKKGNINSGTISRRLAQLDAELGGGNEEELEEGETFAPSHYCVHHGGVQHEGKIHMAEAVGHNWSKESQRVTHYDMKLEDGSVLKNVAFENIQVTEASLAENHEKHSMKRDDEEDKAKGPDKELEERKKRDNPRNDRGMPSRMKMNEEELDEEEDIVNEEENETDVNLNESNDHWYQKQLFEKLSKRWTK